MNYVFFLCFPAPWVARSNLVEQVQIVQHHTEHETRAQRAQGNKILDIQIHTSAQVSYGYGTHGPMVVVDRIWYVYGVIHRIT